MKVLMIDNYDSFTYNLVQYLGELGANVETIRNDAITPQEIFARSAALKPDRIVISPGPCSPAEAGISVALIQAAMGKIPLLGVCLGHQAIGAALGGKIIRAKTLMHGKTSEVEHTGQGVFQGLANPMTVTRYHSLAIERDTLPAELMITAWTQDGEIMGIQHKTYALHGVQFHPESILSEHGHAMLKNFLQEP
jgi:anthranilate synthase component 2